MGNMGNMGNIGNLGNMGKTGNIGNMGKIWATGEEAVSYHCERCPAPASNLSSEF